VTCLKGYSSVEKILDGHLPYHQQYGSTCKKGAPQGGGMHRMEVHFCRHSKCRIPPAYYIKFREARTEYIIVE